MKAVKSAPGHDSRVMPVPGLDPGIVAGIHAFLAGFQRERRGWPGQAWTSPAMTPNNWFNMTGTRSGKERMGVFMRLPDDRNDATTRRTIGEGRPCAPSRSRSILRFRR